MRWARVLRGLALLLCPRDDYRKAVPFSVQRPKMDLPFVNVLCAHSEVPALCVCSPELEYPPASIKKLRGRAVAKTELLPSSGRPNPSSIPLRTRRVDQHVAVEEACAGRWVRAGPVGGDRDGVLRARLEAGAVGGWLQSDDGGAFPHERHLHLVVVVPSIDWSVILSTD